MTESQTTTDTRQKAEDIPGALAGAAFLYDSVRNLLEQKIAGASPQQA